MKFTAAAKLFVVFGDPVEHSLSPTMFSETRMIYNRLFQLQPLGSAPATTTSPPLAPPS